MTRRQAEKLHSLFDREERVTRTDIHRALGRNQATAEIEPLLTDLVSAGVLRMVRQRAPAGRAVDFYELVEDMSDWLEQALACGKISSGPCRPRAGRPPSVRPSRVEDVIYFLQAGASGPIKIGLSCDVALRMSILQIGSPLPLRLLGVMAGSREREMRIHAQFSPIRLHGEWFEPTAELLEYIAAKARDDQGEMGEGRR